MRWWLRHSVCRARMLQAVKHQCKGAVWRFLFLCVGYKRGWWFSCRPRPSCLAPLYQPRRLRACCSASMASTLSGCPRCDPPVEFGGPFPRIFASQERRSCRAQHSWGLGYRDRADSQAGASRLDADGAQVAAPEARPASPRAHREPLQPRRGRRSPSPPRRRGASPPPYRTRSRSPVPKVPTRLPD